MYQQGDMGDINLDEVSHDLVSECRASASFFAMSSAVGFVSCVGGIRSLSAPLSDKRTEPPKNSTSIHLERCSL